MNTLRNTFLTMAAGATAVLLGLGVGNYLNSTMQFPDGTNPAAVKILQNDRVICSGTYMGDGTVLTADHCVNPATTFPSELIDEEHKYVYKVLFQDGSEYVVQGWDQEFSGYDIAIFKVPNIEGQVEADLYCAPVPIGGDIYMRGSPGIPWFSQPDGKMLTSFGRVQTDDTFDTGWATGVRPYLLPNIGGFSGAGVIYEGGVAFVNSGVWKTMYTVDGQFSFGAPVTPLCDSEEYGDL